MEYTKKIFAFFRDRKVYLFCLIIVFLLILFIICHISISKDKIVVGIWNPEIPKENITFTISGNELQVSVHNAMPYIFYSSYKHNTLSCEKLYVKKQDYKIFCEKNFKLSDEEMKDIKFYLKNAKKAAAEIDIPDDSGVIFMYLDNEIYTTYLGMASNEDVYLKNLCFYLLDYCKKINYTFHDVWQQQFEHIETLKMYNVLTANIMNNYDDEIYQINSILSNLKSNTGKYIISVDDINSLPLKENEKGFLKKFMRETEINTISKYIYNNSEYYIYIFKIGTHGFMYSENYDIIIRLNGAEMYVTNNAFSY